MKKRQILAAFLAAACAVSMAVPTFALTDDEKTAVDGAATDKATELNGKVAGTSGDQDVTVETEVQKPTLAVVLPTTVKVFVNPYRAEVATSYEADGTTAKTLSIDTVVSPEMQVENFSDCAVKIGVKGSFITYSYKSAQGDLQKIAANPATDDKGIKITGWDTLTLSGTIEDDTLYADGDIGVAKNYYVKATVPDGESTKDEYRLVTVKATKPVTTAGKEAPATAVISGYTASKTIKVGTAAIKDEDTEKTNTIFMYVEGRKDDESYAGYQKAVAGTKDKAGNMITGGQVALAAKEASQAVLYLEGGNVKATPPTSTTGYIRVSGNAATAPTVAWSQVEQTEGFETPFVFTIDPVANPGEKTPELKTLTAGAGVKEVKSALTAGKYDYAIDVTAGTTSAKLTVSADTGVTIANGKGDGTVAKTVTAANTGVTITIPNTAAAGDKGTATFTLSTKYGKVTTYTITVNIVAAD